MTASKKQSPETRSQLAVGKLYVENIKAVASTMDRARAYKFVGDIIAELERWREKRKPPDAPETKAPRD